MIEYHIGFTGSRLGVNGFQKESIVSIIKHFLEYFALPSSNSYDSLMFHHGDCIGADDNFHSVIGDTLGSFNNIIIHPPKSNSLRAFCTGGWVLDTKDYLDRNHDIVDASHYLIACPKEEKEIVRSGTWATIRYARKQAKSGMIIHKTLTEII